MERLAYAITDHLLRRDVIQKEDYDIYVYGYAVFLEQMCQVIGFILLGIVTKNLLQTALFLGTFYLIRSAFGGYHAETSSKIVLYLIIPCVIINAFQVDYTKKTVNGLLIALAASVLLQVVLLLVVFVMGKLFSLNEVETASIYYSNSGNLIVPIVTFVLGQKWVLYGCVFMSVQLIFLWTHCKKIISRESSYDWKKIILNINMISIAIGAILFFTRIRLPELITNTISSVGNMIGPASMIVTGMLFAGMDLKAIFANKRVYFISALRMLVIPLIALFLIKISHLATLSADAQKIMLIVFLAVITPSASTVTQMCQVYGNDAHYASAINVVTTLCAIVTMPFMVLLFSCI